ncbi:hypothetical protein TNCV_2116631 [Trichonephila clavipes]|nr:hypothetical protein TNCV_2116631 [Trichonephila clavipes]
MCFVFSPNSHTASKKGGFTYSAERRLTWLLKYPWTPDSDDEDEMSKAAAVPASSEMRNIMKTIIIRKTNALCLAKNEERKRNSGPILIKSRGDAYKQGWALSPSRSTGGPPRYAGVTAFLLRRAYKKKYIYGTPMPARLENRLFTIDVYLSK